MPLVGRAVAGKKSIVDGLEPADARFAILELDVPRPVGIALPPRRRHKDDRPPTAGSEHGRGPMRRRGIEEVADEEAERTGAKAHPPQLVGEEGGACCGRAARRGPGMSEGPIEVDLLGRRSPLSIVK